MQKEVKKLIGSLYPKKIVFDETRYRTARINGVISKIFNVDGASSQKKLDFQMKNLKSPVWLPDLDSNQDKQNQNLRYYRYTIGQSAISFLIWECKNRGLAKSIQNIFKKVFPHAVDY